jgi:hypothetical protein
LTVGGGGTNSATDSIGAAQVAGGNTATGSTGTVQSGPVDLTPAVASGPTATAASAPAGSASTPSTSAAGQPSPGTRTSEGAPNRNTFGATRTPTGEPRTIGQLPYTGLGLLLFVLLGLALLATGHTTRARARLRSV